MCVPLYLLQPESALACQVFVFISKITIHICFRSWQMELQPFFFDGRRPVCTHL